MRRISWVPEKLLSSERELCSVHNCVTPDYLVCAVRLSECNRLLSLMTKRCWGHLERQLAEILHSVLTLMSDQDDMQDGTENWPTASCTARHFLFASRHQSNWTALKAGASNKQPKGRIRPAGSLCAAKIYRVTHNKSEGLFCFIQSGMFFFVDRQRSAVFAIRGWWRALYVSRDVDVVQREIDYHFCCSTYETLELFKCTTNTHLIWCLKWRVTCLTAQPFDEPRQFVLQPCQATGRTDRVSIDAAHHATHCRAYTRCDNIIPGMAAWKQILLTCALAAAVAFEILSLWSYALRETMVPLPETVLKIVFRNASQ